MKENLIILSGWGVNPFVWSTITKEFELQYKVYLISWEDVFTSDDFEAKVHSVIEQNHLKRFSLIGWSLGSLVALDLIDIYQTRINKIILIAGTSKFVQSADYKIGWNTRILQQMIVKLQNNPMQVLTEFYKQLFSNSEISEGYDDMYLDTVQNTQESTLPFALKAGLEYLVHKDLRKKIEQIKIPLLLIHGEDDTIIPLQAAHYLVQQLRCATLITFKNCGHIPFFTNQGQCFKSIEDFLQLKEEIYYDQ